MSFKLDSNLIEDFIINGFVRIDDAFSVQIAVEVQRILWKDLPCNKSDPETWKEPVIRLGMYSQKPFVDSVNNPELHSIFDQLIGKEMWVPCRNVGTFPIRFPSPKEPNDTGKHVDASFPGEDPTNYLAWRINVQSKGRALLMLVLYSDVTEWDAPTIIYKGSHIDVARILYPAGKAGKSFMELADTLTTIPEREKVMATGRAGTIYLCHPFMVHAAQAHRGKTPKFMAQPPLLLKEELNISNPEAGFTPVEKAIHLALE